MATTARLGIDIVAADRTKAAFMSAQRSIVGFQRSISLIKGAVAGIAGGNLLASFTRSLVEANREVPAVKAAVDGMKGAFDDFARRVGDAGMNQALINFVNSMSGTMQSTDGVDRAIGTLMGGAINAMASTFTTIGTAVETTTRIIDSFSGALDNLSGKTEVLQKVFGFVWAAATLKPQRDFLSSMLPSVEQIEAAIDGFGRLGAAVQSASGKGDLPADRFMGPISNAAAKGDLVIQKATASTRKLKETVEGIVPALGAVDLGMSALGKTIQDINQTFTSGFSSAIDSLMEGTATVKEAFSGMVTAILKNLTSMFANQAFTQLMNLAFAVPSPSQGAVGPLASLFGSLFGGLRAAGGPVSAGKTYLVGEKGPEFLRMGTSSGAVIPARAGGGNSMKVNVIDQRTNAPAIERRQGADGSLDLIIRDAVNRTLASGSADKAMGRFGVSPIAVRR